MAYSYDELQGSGEPKDTTPKVQLAGDVVPLSIGMSMDDSRYQTQARKILSGDYSTIKQPNAISTPDSDKVTSYGTFLSKKFPLR